VNQDTSQILAVASNILRQQFRQDFINRIDIATHNQRLAQANKEVSEFLMANLAEDNRVLITEFKQWASHTMSLLYRAHKGKPNIQLFRKNYLGIPLGDVYVCCAEIARVVFHAYNIDVEKNDSQGFVEITIKKEVVSSIFRFA